MPAKRRSLGSAPVLSVCVRLVFALVLLTCGLLSAPPPSVAQPSDIIVSVEELDVSSLPTVQVRVSVRNRNGVPIQDLSTEHFEIVEDGATTFVPTGVDVETNPRAQVSLALVIDLYRTLRGEPIEAAQEATRSLLTDLLDEPNDPDRAAFVGVRQDLSTDPSEIDETYEVPFTNDRNQLLNVINFLHERVQTTGPGTPLYDAVIKGIRMAEASEPIAHRAVIVMTDGEDRGSINTDSDTIQRASSARTPVFAVGLSNSGLDEAYLMRLAENSGGEYHTAERPDDFSPLFSNVLSTLRTQYVLQYESGLPQDGQVHSVLVRVRTPTQLEGFQEYRVTVPEGAPPEETGEPALAPDEPTAEPSAETGPVHQDDEDTRGVAVDMDWIQDNLLLAGLAVGALALTLIALVIVALIVMRRRRAAADGQFSSIAPPSYPPSDDFAFDAQPPGGSGDAGATPFTFEDSQPYPATVMDDEPGFGMPPAPAYEGPPAAPSPFSESLGQQPYQPSSEDRTRILQRGSKMSTVGILIDRDDPTNRLDVTKPVVTVGRSQESDLLIDHNTVSRQHAVIKLEEGQFRLYDMGSTNGTFVDEERLREPATLEDGTLVRFGERPFIFKAVSLDV